MGQGASEDCTVKVWSWAVLRLVWEARGWNMKEIPGVLMAKWPGREGLSFSSVQREAQEGGEAPRDIADFIRALDIRKGHEEQAEVVRLGLALLEGSALLEAESFAAELAAKLPTVSPDVIARAVAAMVPTVDMPGLMAKLEALRVGIEGKVDALASKTEEGCERVERKVDSAAAKSDKKLTEVEGKVDKADAKLNRLLWAVGGVGVAVVGVAVLALVPLLRAPASAVTPAPPAAVAPPVPPIRDVIVNVTPGPVADAARGTQEGPPSLMGPITGQMGKSPPERWVPKEPLPGQKKPPCESRLREEILNGGCWQETVGRPPCEWLYRYENKCYRPIAADPDRPVTEPSKP